MIKVNLSGAPRKKVAKAREKLDVGKKLLPALLLAIVAATVGGAYYWYSTLAADTEDVTKRIAQAEQQKAQLEAVIKQDAIYETRKKALENRIRVIEGLRRNQVSPLLSLDILSEAIDRTQYVWLTNLDQNNAILSMSGTGTSVNAIADFVTNLESTGYFRNINLVNAADSAGNFTFSMTCEFAPPPKPAGAAN